MVFSSQYVFTLSAQHGQEIAVATQDVGLILDSCRNVAFVEQLALSNDRISQLDRGAIEKRHVNPLGWEGTAQFMGKASLDTPCIGIAVDEQCQIEVAHGTQVALNLRTEEVD
jgi:hypothetical protein